MDDKERDKALTGFFGLVILAVAVLVMALAGCASPSLNETEAVLEVPTPDVLGSKSFQYANDGPETVALHAKTGILCRVAAHEVCRVTWQGDHYQATRWRSAP